MLEFECRSVHRRTYLWVKDHSKSKVNTKNTGNPQTFKWISKRSKDDISSGILTTPVHEQRMGISFYSGGVVVLRCVSGDLLGEWVVRERVGQDNQSGTR